MTGIKIIYSRAKFKEYKIPVIRITPKINKIACRMYIPTNPYTLKGSPIPFKTSN